MYSLCHFGLLFLRRKGSGNGGPSTLSLAARRSREWGSAFYWPVKSKFTGLDWRVPQIVLLREHLVVRA